MLTPESLTARVADATVCNIPTNDDETRTPRFRRSQLKVQTVFAADGEAFGCGQIAGGAFGAVWPGHADVVMTREELDALFVEFGVNR
jgi:hypothetical protein